VFTVQAFQARMPPSPFTPFDQQHARVNARMTPRTDVLGIHTRKRLRHHRSMSRNCLCAIEIRQRGAAMPLGAAVASRVRKMPCTVSCRTTGHGERRQPPNDKL